MVKSIRVWAAIVTLLSGALSTPAVAQNDVTAEQLFQMAMKAYEKEQYEFARAFFKKACTGGQPGGCFNMGLMTDYGVGGEEDRAKARKYYEQACAGEVGEGCFYLANMYYKGDGGPKNKKQARAFFKTACGLGGVKSCFLFGDMLDRGEGGAKDRPLAQIYYAKACDSAYDLACDALSENEEVY